MATHLFLLPIDYYSLHRAIFLGVAKTQGKAGGESSGVGQLVLQHPHQLFKQHSSQKQPTNPPDIGGQHKGQSWRHPVCYLARVGSHVSAGDLAVAVSVDAVDHALKREKRK